MATNITIYISLIKIQNNEQLSQSYFSVPAHCIDTNIVRAKCCDTQTYRYIVIAYQPKDTTSLLIIKCSQHRGNEC